MTYYKDLIALESDIVKLLDKKTDINIIVKYLNYRTTGKFESKYNKDIEKELNCQLKDNYELTNLLLNMASENKSYVESGYEQLIVPIPNFNIVFKNQQNLHPLVDFLYSILFPFNCAQSHLMLDLYTDETFGNNCSIYELLNIVPYTTNWYGIIYCHKGLFKNTNFITSLKHCKGLFVFSQRLKIRLERILLQRKIDVKVFRLYFPVKEPKTKFKQFNSGSDIIFGSLSKTIEKANVFSFYNTTFKLKSNYWFKTYTKVINKYIIQPRSDEIYEDNILSKINKTLEINEWNYQLITHLFKITNSVQQIMEECDLDEILSENIVFCNIISGSVFVILNECIVRSTPIIINKHPDVVEILGNDYPLYFTEENDIVISLNQIKKAHNYLINLNKTKLLSKFHVSTFISSLNKID